MVANVQTMAYHGEVPWHVLGTTVPAGVTAEAREKATELAAVWQ